jgi:beta-alanine degradation protein BauB
MAPAKPLLDRGGWLLAGESTISSRNPQPLLRGDAMKRKFLLVAVAAIALSNAYAAEDLCSVAPNHCKILKEDAKVRVIEFTAKKGDKIAMHSHPAHVVYLIKAGKTKFTFPDGSARDTPPIKDGEALINPAVTHSQEHLEDVHGILVEFKE